MSYPFNQLSAVAKANLDLSLRLADIARQGSVRAAATLVTALGEAVRPETSPEMKAAVLSEKSFGLFRDAEKIREVVVVETQSAFEAWREAWSAVILQPDEAKATETFSNIMRFWQNLGSVAR